MTPAEYKAQFAKPVKPRRYRNTPTEVAGVKFASKAEARRASELDLMVRAGEIRFLRHQPKFPIIINDILVCNYIGDFAYVREADDVQVVEDVKSPATRKDPVYRLKNKLMRAVCGIQIREVA